MHAEPFPSTLAEFRARYPDEASCRRFLIGRRWPDGFVCAACGRRVAYEITRRVPSRASRVAKVARRTTLFECVSCRTQTSVTAGTLFEHTRLPLTTWFAAAFLVTDAPGGMSAARLGRELGLTNRTTAWFVLRTLRIAMGGDRAPLSGTVDVAGTVLPPRGRGPNARRAPDLPRLVVLLAAVEVLRHLCPDEVGVPSATEHAGAVRLDWADASDFEMGWFLGRAVARDAELRSDGRFDIGMYARWLSYYHSRRGQDPYSEAHAEPLAGRALRDVKRWLRQSRAQASSTALQAALDEWAFHANYRDPAIAFEALLDLSLRQPPLRRVGLVSGLPESGTE